MKLGKLISKAISCIDSKINPPTEKELKDKHKIEFYSYLHQHPGFMAMNLMDQIEDFEMDILSEDYFILRRGESFGSLILHRETIDPSKNLNRLLMRDLEYFRKRVIKLNETYLNGEVSSMENYDRKILRWCFQSEDPEFSSKFFKYLNKLLNGNKT